MNDNGYIFKLNDKLVNLLFINDRNRSKIPLLNEILFVDENIKYKYLTYHEFNILIDQTKNQFTFFNQLDETFFNNLSLHKERLFFCGYYNVSKKIFTFDNMVYNISLKKLGIYVRKHIYNEFKKKDINITIKKEQSNINITVFSLV